MSDSRIPAAAFDFRHRLPIQLRFNDVDMFGHVNNAMYFQFFDLGKLEYLKAVAGGNLDPSAIALVVVNVNCNFYAPVHIDDRVEVLTATVRVGEKSVVIEQRLVGAAGDVKSMCTTVMAGFDPRTGQGAAVSDEWRRLLEDFEGRGMSQRAGAPS